MASKRELTTAPPVLMPRLHASDAQLNHVQRNVAEATEKARADQTTKGREVTATLTASADTQVAHGLGRKPQGWQQRSATGASPAYHEKSKNSRFITFTSTAASDVTVTLWVY